MKKKKVFGEQVPQQWPPRSPDSKPCNLLPVGSPSSRHNPAHVRPVTKSISQEVLRLECRNIFTCCLHRPQAKGTPFWVQFVTQCKKGQCESSGDSKHSRFAVTDCMNNSQFLGFWQGFIGGGDLRGVTYWNTVYIGSSWNNKKSAHLAHSVLIPDTQLSKQRTVSGVLCKLKNGRLVFTQRPSSVTNPFVRFSWNSVLGLFTKTYKLWFREIGFSESRVV